MVKPGELRVFVRKLFLFIFASLIFLPKSQAETTKTLYNPFTQKLDFITSLNGLNWPTSGSGCLQLSAGVLSYTPCGGGNWGIAVGTGSTSGYTGVITSTGTSVILLDSATFKGALQGGSTFFATLNTSSVTLQGPIVSSVTLASMYGSPTLNAANITNLQGAQVGSGVPAANIAVGSLGGSVIASSITLAAMYGSPTVNAANITNIQGAQVGSGVPAANIATGSLGANVIASSVAVNSVYPAGLISGAYTNITGLGTQTGDMAMGTHKLTGIGNGTAATDAAAFGQIFIGFQAPVISSTAASTTTTSVTFVATSLAATITPTSASHRIKISVSGMMKTNTPAAASVRVTLKRGSTELSGQTYGFAASSGAGYNPVSFIFIDSPATTSATTYTVYVSNDDGVTTVSFNSTAATLAVIILEEVI